MGPTTRAAVAMGPSRLLITVNHGKDSRKLNVELKIKGIRERHNGEIGDQYNYKLTCY